MGLNAKNNHLRDYLGITAWHKAGYTGARGLTASGEDFNGASEYAHEYLSRAAFAEVAPDRRVIYAPWRDFPAVSDRCDTIFLSMSVYSFPTAERKTFDAAMGDRCTCLVSAGNHGEGKRNKLMQADTIYGVGAVQLLASRMVDGAPAPGATYSLMPASYSSTSDLVDFCGLTDWRLTDDRPFTGTSCAAPVLCGMAALINDMAIHKTGAPLTHNGMIRLLTDISLDMEMAGHDNKTGWGLPILPPPESINIYQYQEGVMTINDELAKLPDWARPTVEKLVSKGALKGDEQGLNLSYDLMRTLVILDRLGKLEEQK